MKAKLIKNIAEEYYLVVLHKNIPKWFNAAFELSNGYYAIASSTKIDGVGEFPLLSLKNCQAIELGYDIEDLATDAADNYDSSGNWHVAYELFKAGFQKCLELMGDKRFSEEDVGNLWDFCVYNKGTFKEYIQSLQQTEWDVTFNHDELDTYGCLILKRINL